MKRFRGDSYPMIFNLIIDDKPANLSNVASVTFAYLDKENNIRKIDGSIEDSDNGVVKFNVSESFFDTAGVYYYDIQVVYDDGIKQTFEKDKITILDDINKD